MLLPLLCAAALAPAPADPLAGVPAEATLTVVIDDPRALVEKLTALPAVAAARTLAPVKEALGRPGVKKFFDLVAYYEADLGKDWPEVLDAVAGGGVTVAAKAQDDNDLALVVVRGTDEAATKQFVELALKVAVAEAAKKADADAKPPAVRRARHDGVETVHFGPDFHLARVGATVTVANREAALHKSLDAAAGKAPRLGGGPAAAPELLGGEPLVVLWADLTAAKATPASKDFFANAKKQIIQMLVSGSTIDAVRRADYVAAGVYADAGDLTVAVKLPAPRSGLPKEYALHAPPEGQPGSLPLLNPAGTVWSQSFYLDLATLWTDRTWLFAGDALTDFEKGVADISRVLPGPGLAELLAQSGPHHRVVVVAPPAEPLYKSAPAPALPGGALVMSMRSPEFGATAVAALRAGGAVASLAAGLTMAEDEVGGVTVVSYKFPEGKPLEADPDGLRFHTMPAFAVVGDSLVLASRPDVIKSLIPELKKPAGESARAVWRGRLSGPGLAAWATAHPDALVADAILRQGVTLADAKKQVADLAAVLAKAGPLTAAIDHGPAAYEWRVTLHGK